MRVSPKTIRQARSINRYLPLLLRPNKTIESAQRELSWIKSELPVANWHNAIIRRSHYEPLQYILGTQPFGELDIICKPGVLIPRWETEGWVLRLADTIISKNPSEIAILDVCTGTGCIAILLNHLLSAKGIKNSVTAIDISSRAIEVAKLNAKTHNSTVTFVCEDIFKMDIDKYDLIVSNPPYIPPREMLLVERSVQLYEPELALIGDLEFYDQLVRLVELANASWYVFEVGYQQQANRVMELMDNWKIDTWSDSRGHLRCVVGEKNA